MAAAAAGIFLLNPCSRPAGRLHKPSPPIEVTAEFSSGRSGAFRVAARAASPLDADIRLELLLPEGTVLTDGIRTAQSRTPELRAEGSAGGRLPQGLLLRASLSSGGARLERVVPLGLPPDRHPTGTLKKNSRGETIREFEP